MLNVDSKNRWKNSPWEYNERIIEQCNCALKHFFHTLQIFKETSDRVKGLDCIVKYDNTFFVVSLTPMNEFLVDTSV